VLGICIDAVIEVALSLGGTEAQPKLEFDGRGDLCDAYPDDPANVCE